MLMTLDFDRRPVKLQLNWKSKTWRLLQDTTGIWRNGISHARKGPFRRRSRGALWIDDLVPRRGETKQLTRVVIWNSPYSDADARRIDGVGIVWIPRHRSNLLRRRQELGWSVQTLIPPGGPLTALRQAIVKQLKQKFAPGVVITPGKPEFFELTGNMSPPKSGTNCYALGTGLARLAGQHKGKKANSTELTQFIGRFSLASTSGLQRKAKNNSWTDANGSQLPRPGDFFALLSPGLANTPENRRKGSEYAHVGVLLAYQNQGKIWITADFGQLQSPGGYGTRRVRTYYPGSNKLSSPGTGYPPRVVAGWVNIDKHFG